METIMIPLDYVAIPRDEYDAMNKDINELFSVIKEIKNLVRSSHSEYLKRGYSDNVDCETLARSLGMELEERHEHE